ncbi:phage tail tube protein [Candidatus Saccharibacteria bacterium]|nr:phage tail tube protein [Candidatus Saccharibacteria bacterium]
MATAQRAIGTSLTMVKSGDETADTIIARVSSIGEVNPTHSEIDVTTLDSPNGAQEFIAGATDSGSLAVSGQVPSGASQLDALYSVFKSREVRDWIVTWPDGTKIDLSGFINGFTFGEAAPDGLITFSVEIRVSGLPKLTPATAP